jgi:hypothetical protein
MKSVYKIDQEGYFVEQIILNVDDGISADCVEIAPPEGLFKLKWNGESWEEGYSQDEIHTLTNNPQPPSEIEQLKKQQADLTFTLMMAGVI